ncbi:MAG: hypothetical protein AAFZ18_07665, partial [Myxococcota bacterium]
MRRNRRARAAEASRRAACARASRRPSRPRIRRATSPASAERLAGRPASIQSDVYALGVILF